MLKHILRNVQEIFAPEAHEEDRSSAYGAAGERLSVRHMNLAAAGPESALVPKLGRMLQSIYADAPYKVEIHAPESYLAAIRHASSLTLKRLMADRALAARLQPLIDASMGQAGAPPQTGTITPGISVHATQSGLIKIAAAFTQREAASADPQAVTRLTKDLSQQVRSAALAYYGKDRGHGYRVLVSLFRQAGLDEMAVVAAARQGVDMALPGKGQTAPVEVSWQSLPEHYAALPEGAGARLLQVCVEALPEPAAAPARAALRAEDVGLLREMQAGPATVLREDVPPHLARLRITILGVVAGPPTPDIGARVEKLVVEPFEAAPGAICLHRAEIAEAVLAAGCAGKRIAAYTSRNFCHLVRADQDAIHYCLGDADKTMQQARVEYAVAPEPGASGYFMLHGDAVVPLPLSGQFRFGQAPLRIALHKPGAPSTVLLEALAVRATAGAHRG